MSTAAPEAPVSTAPFEFADAHVLRTLRLGPTLLRVTFGGAALRRLECGGRDQRIKLFLPRPGQEAPLLPADRGPGWFAAWRAMDPALRAVMRSYTVRAQRTFPAPELDVDFALHGTAGPAGAFGAAPAGPASRWAAGARPGDRVVLLGPVEGNNAGVDFRPPPGTDWVLLAGDETALPALGGILDWLPAGTPARVWIEVPHAGDIQDLPTRADAHVTWLVRESGSTLARPGAPASPAPASPALDAVRSAALPSGAPYAWLAGESGTVRALRRHLVRERGFERRAVTFTGYWRRGAAEEQLVEEAVAASAA